MAATARRRWQPDSLLAGGPKVAAHDSYRGEHEKPQQDEESEPDELEGQR
jgi:hypothetical protein